MARLRLGHSRTKACAGGHCARRPCGQPHAFALLQTDCKLPEEGSTPDRSRHFAHSRRPTAVCAPRAGFQKGEEGVVSSAKRKSQFSTPTPPPPSTAQLPGDCPEPRQSSAQGNKYLYGDNYSIWEENPIKQEPCRAANAGTELEAATPPSFGLLPIMQELPVLPPLVQPQKSTTAPAGSLCGLGHPCQPPGSEMRHPGRGIPICKSSGVPRGCRELGSCVTRDRRAGPCWDPASGGAQVSFTSLQFCHLNNNNKTIYWALAVCQAQCKVHYPALPHSVLKATPGSRSCHLPCSKGKEAGGLRSRLPPEHLPQFAITHLFSHCVIRLHLPCWTKTRREGAVLMSVQHYSLSRCRHPIDSYLLKGRIKPHNWPKVPQLLNGRKGPKTWAGWLQSHAIMLVHPTESPCPAPCL